MGIALKHLSESTRAQIARSLFKITSEDHNKGELHGLCPIHGDKNPSFSYNYKKDVYKCLSSCTEENADGDLAKLWIIVKGFDRREGFKAFCREYGIEIKHDDHNGAEGGERSRGNRSPADYTKGSTPSVPDPAAPAPPELSHEQIVEQMHRAWEKFPALPAGFVARMEKERGWSPAMIEMLDLRLETWRLSKKGELYQVKDPVKISIPIRDADGNLINIRLYQPGAKEYKIISFGKTTGKSALFPAVPIWVSVPDNFYKELVLLTEGESDTICALSHGFNAITQTSKLIKWPDDHLKPFKGRDVVIAYDADAPGQKYARAAAEALKGVAKSVRMLLWPAFMGIDESGAIPDKHGQDLTDFFVHHKKSAADLQVLIDGATPWPPPPVEIAAQNLTHADDKNQVSGEPAPDTIEDTNDMGQFWDYGISADRKSFKPRLLAEKILQDHKLMFDPGTGILYQWNGKYWAEYEREYLEAACARYLRIEAKQSRMSDAAYQARILSTLTPGRAVNDKTDFICIQNGMLNINTFEIVPHDPDYLSTYALPVTLDPKSTKRCEVFEHYLETSVQDPEAIAQMQEFAGYIISRDTKYEKCLFLLGPGRDGKSKFINAMKDMVGIDNMSAVSFADLEKEFARSSLYNKMLNVSTEIGSQVIESAYFKAITSGDPIQAAFKHKDNFTFTPYCKLIFAGNILPRIKDNSDALFERVLPIQFKRQFLEGDKDRDEHLGDKLKEERSEIFYWALCGLKRLREQRRFSDSAGTRKLMMEFRRSNNPILCFIEDRCNLGEGQSVAKEDLLAEYNKYCKTGNYKPTNANNFFRELYHAVGRLRIYQARVGEKRPRIAEGIGLKPQEVLGVVPE
jgi:putative DNA primase/helicase